MSNKFSFFIFFYFSILTINSQRNLLEEEKSDDIIILHTNDVHCGINDTIGYDGVMLYKRELETIYKHVLLVDAGDHIQGGPISFLSKGEDIIQIMNAMGYDAVTIGNHEFDYKIEYLMELNKTLNSGYICANICWKNKKPIFPPYKIIELDKNIKIGFIGVTTPQSFTRTYLHNLIGDEDKYDFLLGNNGTELYDTIQNYTDELRNEKNVDYVIILSHLGYKGDVKYEFTSKGLLANIKGVDAIIDGHSHVEYNSTFEDKENKSVYIIQTGTKLKKVGKLTLKRGNDIDNNITSELISEIPLFNNNSISYKTVNRGGIDRYVDQEIYDLIENITKNYSSQFNVEIGHTDFDLLINKGNARLTFFEENPLGDLVTDAIKNITNTDIGMMMSLFIAGGIKKGNISYKNILDILSASSRMIIKEMKGKDILDILELSASFLPEASYKFLQVSGIKFTVDENIKSPVEFDDIQDFVRVNGERRVSDVYIGDEKLDENKTYKIATDDYISYGGGGYTMISKYNVADDTEKVDSNILKDYIKDVLNENIPDIYKSGQGRIKIIKKSDDSNQNSNSFIVYFSELSLVLLSLLF